MAKKVSIITALYNHESYIAQTIESVLAQTFTDYELIIWDDGSKDNGPEIAKSYVRKYPGKVFFYQHENRGNHGQEATRNEALKVCTGQYICLLDSDDLWFPKKLELQVQKMDSNLNAAICYGQTQVLIEKFNRQVALTNATLPDGMVFDQLIQSNFINACSVMIRRECIKGIANPFEKKYGAIGEFPLWLQLAHRWPLLAIQEPIAIWRSHAENTGTKRRLQGRRELVDMAAQFMNDKEYQEHRSACVAAWNQYRYDLAVMLVEDGNREEKTEGMNLLSQIESDSEVNQLLRKKASQSKKVYSLGQSAIQIVKSLKKVKMLVVEPKKYLMEMS